MEDMLRAYVLDFRGSWKNHVPLIEFAYNNSYQETIQMSPLARPYMEVNLDRLYVGIKLESLE